MAEEEIHSASLAVSLTRLQDFPGECDKITFCSVSPPTPHSLKVIFIRKVFTSGPTTRASLVAWEVYSEGLARHPHPRRPPFWCWPSWLYAHHPLLQLWSRDFFCCENANTSMRDG